MAWHADRPAQAHQLRRSAAPRPLFRGKEASWILVVQRERENTANTGMLFLGLDSAPTLDQTIAPSNWWWSAGNGMLVIRSLRRNPWYLCAVSAARNHISDEPLSFLCWCQRVKEGGHLAFVIFLSLAGSLASAHRKAGLASFMFPDSYQWASQDLAVQVDVSIWGCHRAPSKLRRVEQPTEAEMEAGIKDINHRGAGRAISQVIGTPEYRPAKEPEPWLGWPSESLRSDRLSHPKQQ
ncbi:hypothetical protein B0I35DRAFT_406642 [Stachybotrys elegans]|uniref:Uncharacterized protein n=1 Tax=Stachybotrys elegans TaxID=80388 RepID=A0A8K0SWD2_9HYPO|nr:hypothetical protein B0I35DRAFT_406642 [Stachybotrys elegans]